VIWCLYRPGLTSSNETDMQQRVTWCALLVLAGVAVAHGQGLTDDPLAVAKAGGSFDSFDKVIAAVVLILRTSIWYRLPCGTHLVVCMQEHPGNSSSSRAVAWYESSQPFTA
jgi:hypothetical protein